MAVERINRQLVELGRRYDAQFVATNDVHYINQSDAKLQDVLLAEGSRIRKSEITHSIIGIRSQISEGAVIRDSIIIGADYYIPKRHPEVPIGLGRNCHIEGAILDKNVQIGESVIIRPFTNSPDIDHELYFVRDGVVVIAKDTLIPAGTCIEPR